MAPKTRSIQHAGEWVTARCAFCLNAYAMEDMERVPDGSAQGCYTHGCPACLAELAEMHAELHAEIVWALQHNEPMPEGVIVRS